ncbi:hypothetical protein PIROE2DRAFT_14901 [Piromyces sp. E2]|nr:hypothetical protein PIROE2DRAFT_14901 [Piromyces sp. E2]|eukprot:OUM59541.1 hypothetical protein PIROE2DRAFT_14901 [Piromyces sp. E2]
MIIIKNYFVLILIIISCFSNNVCTQIQNLLNTNVRTVNVGVKTLSVTNTTDIDVNALRVVIFASYSDDKIIHDYILSYLKYLREISWKIIFIADNEISDMEKSKLKNLVDFLHCEKHGEYDFGSYKRVVSVCPL